MINAQKRGGTVTQWLLQHFRSFTGWDPNWFLKKTFLLLQLRTIITQLVHVCPLLHSAVVCSLITNLPLTNNLRNSHMFTVTDCHVCVPWRHTGDDKSAGISLNLHPPSNAKTQKKFFSSNTDQGGEHHHTTLDNCSYTHLHHFPYLA